PDRRLLAVREIGIAVAELLGEIEPEALRDLDRPRRRGEVDTGEAGSGVSRSAQDALAVAAALLLAAVERSAAADRNERVLEERAPRLVGVHVAGGDGVDAGVGGEIPQGGIASRVTSLVGPLQLDEEVVAAEGTRQADGDVRIAHGEAVVSAAGQA